VGTKVKVIVIGVFVVVLGIVWFVASKMEEKQPGTACETYRNDCAGPNGACLVTSGGQYCTHACSADADCPATWKCADVASDTYSGKTGQKVSTRSTKMCVKP
jgi:hypothetical protein